jgi:hypothetical protein
MARKTDTVNAMMMTQNLKSFGVGCAGSMSTAAI